MEPIGTLEALRQELSGRGLAEANGGGPRDAAFRTLFHSIVSLEVEPGAMLSEQQLMALAECSRSALRPAVIRLEELGLLRSLPRKGLVVAPLDGLDAANVYEAREAIERKVVRLAAQRARGQQLALLDELVGLWARSDEEGWSWRTFIERDQELHLAIASMAGNRYLYDALTRILPLATRLWHWVYGTLGTDEHVRFHHRDIVDAVRAGDPDAAEEAVAHHIQRARGQLADLFVARWQGVQR